MLKNFLDYHNYSPRLNAYNAAIKDMRNVGMLMDSLSVVEKRTSEKKTQAVKTVEESVLLVT